MGRLNAAGECSLWKFGLISCPSLGGAGLASFFRIFAQRPPPVYRSSLVLYGSGLRMAVGFCAHRPNLCLCGPSEDPGFVWSCRSSSGRQRSAVSSFDGMPYPSEQTVDLWALTAVVDSPSHDVELSAESRSTRLDGRWGCRRTSPRSPGRRGETASAVALDDVQARRHSFLRPAPGPEAATVNFPLRPSHHGNCSLRC